MPDLNPRLIAILKKYMRDPASRVTGSTTLAELEIDILDLPMILLDVEDAFDIQIDDDDEIEGSATVDRLAACVAARLAAKALQPRRRTTVPRSKGSWISTGAERRR
jgi:acyl carrier protein